MSSSNNADPSTTVLVVDDSTFMRRMISDMISRFPGYEVIGTAGDGKEALSAIERLDPDLVTLDIEMPRLDGFGVLERVMASVPRRFVVLSAYTAEGSRSALRALDLGAVELVAKPSGPISFDVGLVESKLYQALEAAREADIAALLRQRSIERATPVRAPDLAGDGVVAIAASTGGPRALNYIVSSLPADLGAAVLVVQHMPPGFTATLAARLDEMAPLSVAEARGGEIIVPNHVWLAPGDFHMRVRGDERSARIVLDQRALIWGTRPAADALFTSLADTFGRHTVGVVLTGMGRDGSAGLAAIRAAGGRTLAQDRESCVVYGMPARAVESGAVERSVPLSALPAAIVDSLASLSRGGVERPA